MTERIYLPGTVRERIQDLLKERKITQATLAKHIGCSESTLSRFLRGDTEKIGNEALIAAAEFLNVSTDFLLGLTDCPDTPQLIDSKNQQAEFAKNILSDKTDSLGATYNMMVHRMIDDLTHGGTKDLKAVTKEEIVDEILNTVSVLDLPYSDRARLKEAFLPLFTKGNVKNE